MKNLKWIAMILMVISLVLGIVGCEQTTSCQHTFSTEWSSNAVLHWKEATCGCDIVGEESEHIFGEWVITNPTEESEGSEGATCGVCGYKLIFVIPKLEHTHTFETKWTFDETNHWKEATCQHTDEVCEKSQHTFNGWNVTKEPTESTEGTSEKKCDICNFRQEVSLSCAPEGFVFVKGGTIEGAEYKCDIKGVFIEGRTVTLSDFYMGKYEVTQEEYESVMENQKVVDTYGREYTLQSTPSYCHEESSLYIAYEGEEYGKRPVEGVTWYDAVWYCNTLSEKEGLIKAYDIKIATVSDQGHIEGGKVSLIENATGYRLPTEAEWEYAARGGDPTTVDWNYLFSGAETAKGYLASSDSGLDSVGWYEYNHDTGTTCNPSVTDDVPGDGTHQVGKKAPNRLGLYDMSGNVSEWCYDLLGSINTGVETNPTGAVDDTLDDHASRGGSWSKAAYFASVSFRLHSSPHNRCNYLGFRVVRPSSN